MGKILGLWMKGKEVGKGLGLEMKGEEVGKGLGLGIRFGKGLGLRMKAGKGQLCLVAGTVRKPSQVGLRLVTPQPVNHEGVQYVHLDLRIQRFHRTQTIINSECKVSL